MSNQKIKFIRLNQVKERTGLERSTIYERIKTKTFPAQISLGGKSVAWIESEITDWMNHQVESSRQAETL